MVVTPLSSASGSERQQAPRGFDRFLSAHRGWLKRRGLLDRPWFVLGSAPSPTIPGRLPDGTAFVHVKYAGRSAKALGLPPGDLSFLLDKTREQDVEGLHLDNILRMRKRHNAATLFALYAPLGTFRECAITHQERDDAVIGTLGSLFGGIGVEKRPSNGVALLCYAIAVGVPQIIVAGLSLDSDGYAYDPAARTRRHVPEDRAALKAAAMRYPQLVTSEPSLHAATGLALYRGEHNGPGTETLTPA